jgi:hypothetical protein
LKTRGERRHLMALYAKIPATIDAKANACSNVAFMTVGAD